MSFPRKEQRLKCYSARDQFWSCLDQHYDGHQKNASDEIPTECQKLKTLFETECPQQWTQHFNRKYQYLKFKQKIETGYEPIDDDDHK
ncbi:cytochrome c oxidase assembly factor 6 homolog [Dermatophagoides pteronyssinus]|uniref:Cytochrome c oxidase assembly factor 6 n=2 Tax=Dermatophagoides pteronyssinus TaxID=6956 RepID=A0ABQ8JQ17_DERPT|nr:cytochrome c oxidase assembly factor 6 homolog [Dermatophagoides pteronyssinus]KAH9424708.1 Cytochrome c oxidase assembly factor 6 [Dermatophagoides pteronyssinus]